MINPLSTWSIRTPQWLTVPDYPDIAELKSWSYHHYATARVYEKCDQQRTTIFSWQIYSYNIIEEITFLIDSCCWIRTCFDITFPWNINGTWQGTCQWEQFTQGTLWHESSAWCTTIHLLTWRRICPIWAPKNNRTRAGWTFSVSFAQSQKRIVQTIYGRFRQFASS